MAAVVADNYRDLFVVIGTCAATLIGLLFVAMSITQEETAARETAEDGAKRASEHGFNATARVQEATEGVWRAIVDVADEIDAGLIVCGNRGRGGVKGLLLGSVSHVVLAHAGRPVLIAPER